MWRFVDVDLVGGAYSTALFHAIGHHVGSGSSHQTILFWRVRRPTLYLGYHQYVADEADETFCSREGVDIIRRVLGGGCGYCDSDQILYAVIGRDGAVIPGNVQDAYHKVLKGPVLALKTLGLDGELDPVRNGVFVQGRKISGNAQGRFDGAVMVNGSFLLDFDFSTMERVLKHPTKNLPPHVRTAREGMVTLSDLVELPDLAAVKHILLEGFENALDVRTFRGELSREEAAMTQELTEQYESREWTYRMDDKRKKRLMRRSSRTVQ